jgi:Lipocalin-like domain
MKYAILLGLILLADIGQAQTIIGTWQLTEEKTCFESNIKESETEKELLPQMNSSGNSSVARIIKFDKKGNGEDGIFSVGKKKGAGMSEFKYTVKDNVLALLDGKSGIMTQQLIIDELTASTLKVHNGKNECETKVFSRVK